MVSKSSTFVLKTRLGFSVGIIGIALALQIWRRLTSLRYLIFQSLYMIFFCKVWLDICCCCCCCLFFSIPNHYLPFLNKQNSISPLPIFVHFSPLFYRLGATVQCRIEVVITGILVSFLISREKFHYYYVSMYDVCSSFFVATLHWIKEVSSVHNWQKFYFAPYPHP